MKGTYCNSPFVFNGLCYYKRSTEHHGVHYHYHLQYGVPYPTK